jgi:hypothetical protein
MALYAIGDLHLSLSGNKSMEVFGEAWRDYVPAFAGVSLCADGGGYHRAGRRCLVGNVHGGG